jgi:hypothetical protein
VRHSDSTSDRVSVLGRPARGLKKGLGPLLLVAAQLRRCAITAAYRPTSTLGHLLVERISPDGALQFLQVSRGAHASQLCPRG